MDAVRALLARAIDYAGMFPPAGLDLATTVDNYATYRASEDAWALGRLILPVGAIAEFADRWPERVRHWPVSLLLGEEFEEEITIALGFGFAVDAVECRLARVREIAEVRRLLPKARVFIEMPAGADRVEWMRAMRETNACAKLRMGGVTSRSIPSVPDVAAFLLTCAKSGVRFKATAGLHHAIRGERALTYEQGSERAVMHGFVNLLVAAAIVYGGGDAVEARAALEDEAATSFEADAGELRWQGRRVSAAEIAQMRSEFAMSFGSCSFTEPMEEMRAMGWMR